MGQGVTEVVTGISEGGVSLVGTLPTGGASLAGLTIAAGQVTHGGAITYKGFSDFKENLNKFNASGNNSSGNTERIQNVSKQKSKIWNDLENVKGQSRKMSGEGRKRQYYEWDALHNEIEVYNHKGVHIGVMDPLTGKMYKKAVPGRRIDI